MANKSRSFAREQLLTAPHGTLCFVASGGLSAVAAVLVFIAVDIIRCFVLVFVIVGD